MGYRMLSQRMKIFFQFDRYVQYLKEMMGGGRAEEVKPGEQYQEYSFIMCMYN